MSVSFSFFFPSFLSSTFHFIFNDSTTIVRPLSTTVQPITTAIRPLFGHHSAVVWPIIVVWPITTANRLSFGHCLAVFWPQFDRCSEVVQPLFGHHSTVVGHCPANHYRYSVRSLFCNHHCSATIYHCSVWPTFSCCWVTPIWPSVECSVDNLSRWATEVGPVRPLPLFGLHSIQPLQPARLIAVTPVVVRPLRLRPFSGHRLVGHSGLHSEEYEVEDDDDDDDDERTTYLSPGLASLQLIA